MEHVWSVVCSRSVIDQASNNISLFEVVEKVTAVAPGQGDVTLIPLQAELVTLWARSDPAVAERGRARVMLLDPENVPLMDPTFYDIDLSTYARLRNRIQLNGLPVRGSGLYHLRLELELDGTWVRIQDVPIEVEVALQPAAEQVRGR